MQINRDNYAIYIIISAKITVYNIYVLVSTKYEVRHIHEKMLKFPLYFIEVKRQATN